MSKDVLAEYKRAGAELIALSKEIDEAKLHAIPAPGEWPISYIIHHLFDAETYFATRYMNILIYDNPPIVMFDEELLPGGLEYPSRSVAASITGLQGIHAVMEDLLSHISDEKWNRTGAHPEAGPVTLAQVVAKQASHVTEHVNHIKKLLA